jgi:DNA-binding transcriptional MocR family regulator
VLVENDTYGELRYQGEPLPHPRIHRLFLESVA